MFNLNLSIFEIQLKINLFKLGKNKRFNYNPRYFKDHTKKTFTQLTQPIKKTGILEVVLTFLTNGNKLD